LTCSVQQGCDMGRIVLPTGFDCLLSGMEAR
jgi:hypothetical protein